MAVTHLARSARGLLLTVALVCGVTACTATGTPVSVGAAATTGATVAGEGLPWGFGDLHCSYTPAALGPIGLTEVSVSRPPAAAAPAVTARFVLSRTPGAEAGVLELAVGLYDRTGAPRESLAVRFGDGHPHLLAYVPADGSEEQLPGVPAVEGSTVTARFPVDPATVTGGPWQWRAVVEVDGSTVGACPQG